MNRLTLFAAVACIYSLAFTGKFISAAEAETPDRSMPNFVILFSDDAGYHEFSLHGAHRFPTPRIDSIARHGVMFTNGYVSGTVCSPSRAGLLTGRYQNRFGHEFNIPPVYSETNGLSLDETLLPAVLKSAGYRTIALGKWHLGYAPQFHPMSRGFTDYYGFLQGSRSYFPLEKPNRLNQLLRDRKPVRPEKFEYMTDELADAAAKYIADSKDQPFFMYVAFNAIHTPNHVLQKDLDALGDDTQDAKHRAMTIALDRAVGVILDEIEKQGLTDNTMVVFLNDNGGAQGHDNTPLRGQKGSTWEGGVRVPFAMQWPGVLPEGKVVDQPVIALDIFPTMMHAAGISQTSGKPLDGVDLTPFLTGQTKAPPHQTLYWKSGANWAIRDGDLKLVVSKGGSGQPQLYDLQKDQSEQTDLAAQYPQKVEQLSAMYREWKKDFPTPTWGGGNAKSKK
ncbi:sulfatase-like hydrolase/transferase [Blastopirellula marina]|uniref:Sulfatase n=1 Tax=Blastopirellula marina TaxID=124 RepID=A0A2S8FNT1_9BACT|nr:sulfatase-like hydrolase/transferase [Blastopirellula marina]PQO33831.1 sulfatase [Blastopirellula marina]PTL43618.1 sulfatase [Blastopirellula marina]